MRRSLFWLVFVAGFLLLADSLSAQPAQPNETTAVVFLRDGGTVLSADLAGKLCAWDAATGKERWSKAVMPRGLQALALSPDGKLLASAGSDGIVRLHDPRTGKVQQSITAHAKEATALAFSPDGKLLASGGYDGVVVLWDGETGKEVRRAQTPIKRVTSLAFTPDGKTLAGAGTGTIPMAGLAIVSSEAVLLWDVATLKAAGGSPGLGSTVAFGADGRTLAVGGYSVHEVGPGEPAQIRINQLALKPGNRIALLNRKVGVETLQVKGRGNALALSADGRLLATARGGERHIYGQPGCIFGMKELAAGISLWEAASGKPVREFSVPEDVGTVLAFSPDGRRLAAGKRSGGIRLLDLTPERFDPKAAANLDRAGLEQRLRLLDGGDARLAQDAIWTLGACGDRVTALLAAELKPIALDVERVKKKLGELDSDDFEVRDAAAAELKKLAGLIEPELRQALAAATSAEARRSLKELVSAAESATLAPEGLRQGRAIAVLERIGTPEAKALLRQLAGGAPGAPLTQQAAQALQRLGRP